MHASRVLASSPGRASFSGRTAAEPRWLRGALAWFCAATLAEMILLRFVYRVGIYIPKDGVALAAFRALTRGGDVALRMEWLAGLAVAAGIAWPLAVDRRPAARAAATALAALAALVAAGVALPDAAAATAPALVLALLAAAWLACSQPGRMRRAGVLLVAAMLTLAMLGPALDGPALRTAATAREALVPLAGLAFALAARGSPRANRALYAGAAAGAAVAAVGGWFTAPTAILALWGWGVTLSLPLPVYVLAAAAWITATVALLGDPPRRAEGLGVLLLVLAGSDPTTTALRLAAAAGLLLLAGALPHPPPVPEEASA